MLITLLFGLVFSLSLALATVLGYYMGVKNTMSYYNSLVKSTYKRKMSELEKFDNDGSLGEDKVSN